VAVERSPVRVFLNPGATYGTGVERWRLLEGELRGRVGELEVEELDVASLPERLSEAVVRGERRFVAAGGDGSVGALANAMMTLPADADVALGAVGLGSSNDFHKPFDAASFIAGMPVAVDFDRASARDVIRIDYRQRDGSSGKVYAVVNASAGVTAEANAAFNEPNALIRAARSLSVDAAISAAVLTTLATYRDLTCALSVDAGDAEMVSVTNLGVYKNPHFGGALRYDTEVGRDDGTLGVGLCEGLTKLRTVATLAALRKGRFRGRAGTRSWVARELTVDADREFALEADGETVRATGARFSVDQRRLRCCR
jgi:diacylglycerol kinase (ATP)